VKTRRKRRCIQYGIMVCERDTLIQEVRYRIGVLTIIWIGMFHGARRTCSFKARFARCDCCFVDLLWWVDSVLSSPPFFKLLNSWCFQQGSEASRCKFCARQVFRLYSTVTRAVSPEKVYTIQYNIWLTHAILQVPQYYSWRSTGHSRPLKGHNTAGYG